jgi:hypothetical protein
VVFSLSCFLSSIGKLWADGGLRDLLVDSGVYAGNTAELMLVGKEFNYLNVGDAPHPHFLNLPIRGCTWSSNNSSTLVSSTDVSIF